MMDIPDTAWCPNCGAAWKVPKSCVYGGSNPHPAVRGCNCALSMSTDIDDNFRRLFAMVNMLARAIPDQLPASAAAQTLPPGWAPPPPPDWVAEAIELREGLDHNVFACQTCLTVHIRNYAVDEPKVKYSECSSCQRMRERDPEMYDLVVRVAAANREIGRGFAPRPAAGTKRQILLED